MTKKLVFPNFLCQGVHLYETPSGYVLMKDNRLVIACPGGFVYWEEDMCPYTLGCISHIKCSCPCRHWIRRYPNNTHVQDMYNTCRCCERHDDPTIYPGPDSDLDMHYHHISTKLSKKIQSGSSSRQECKKKKKSKKKSKKDMKKLNFRMQSLQEYYN